MMIGLISYWECCITDHGSKSDKETRYSLAKSRGSYGVRCGSQLNAFHDGIDAHAPEYEY